MKRGLQTFILMLIAAILGSMLTVAVGGIMLQPISVTQEQGTVPPQPATYDIGKADDVGVSIANVYKSVIDKAQPSVVGITSNITVQNQGGFFGPQSYETSALGTGVIVDSNGYILTNSHVVEDGKAKDVMVLLHDGSKEKAEILMTEPALDLAVVKINKTDLKPADLADSSKAQVGDIAVAIGNPLGLEFKDTVTEGIISGLNRSVTVQNTQMNDLIQTTAAINSGNSGGPLLNTAGQVVGISSAKAGSGEAMGFAIPINTAKPIIDQFKNNGTFSKVTLGISYEALSTVKQYTDYNFGSAEYGVVVMRVEPNSAASRAGLEQGDVVTHLNNVEIRSGGDLVKELYTLKSGDSAELTLIRNQKAEKIRVQF